MKRNYMLDSIDDIIKYGLFEFKVDNDFSYCIYLGEDNKLRLMRKNDKIKVFSEEDDKEFINALSYVVSGSFTNNFKLELCSKENYARGGSYDKKILLEAVTNCYLSMMDDEFFNNYKKGHTDIQGIMIKIGNFIIPYEEFENNEVYRYAIQDCSYNFYKKLLNNPNYLNNDKTTITKQLSMYASMLDSYNKDDNFDIEVEIMESKRKPIPEVKTSRKIDTRILDKNSIVYSDLTDREYSVNPAIGREKEIRKLGSTLLSPLLSPVLLGEAGVGKTAIVQGIAYAIKNNNVSSKLLDKKIIEITPNSLVSGTRYRGDFEQRVEVLIKFLRENPDVILYLDEFHAIKKLGSSEDSGNDFMNSLKPYIGNGETKIIGATTKDEYKKFITTDKAFDRRFRDIIVEEPDNRLLKLILDSNIEKFENQTSIRFGSNDFIREEMINYLIDITNYAYRMPDDIKYNPGLALSILSEAYGYAAYDLKNSVNPDYLVEASRECNSLMQESIKPKTKSLFLKSVIADRFSE